MSWAAIAATVVGAAASAGVAYASQPNYPNPAASSRRTVLAQLRTLPGQRIVDVAARMGVPVDYPTGKIVPKYENKSIAQALADGNITQQMFNNYISSKSYGPDTVIKVQTGSMPEMAHADFTGYGDADVQGALARAQAQNQLDLSKKYAPQFIQSAKEQEALANPEGVAARQMLADEINKMAANHPERPVANTLDAQILDELKHGKSTTSDLDAAVANVVGRRAGAGTGGGETAGDITSAMAQGPEGQQRLQQRLQKAMGYLSSGVSPEDVQYRENQQDLANMANFLAGRTPTAQFQTLSGGQQGAAPTARAPGVVNPQISYQQANQAGVQGLNLATQAQNNNVNPWFAGLNILTRGLGVAGAAGYQPFKGGP